MWCAITFDGGVDVMLTSLDLTRSMGTPCDAFEARMIWSKSVADAAAECKTVRLYADGKLVFTGVVDEVVCEVGGDGRGLEVAGRGMAALMMRREMNGAQYDVAAWRDIRARLVDPCGVTAVADESKLGAVRKFSITSGQSAFSALCDWCGAAGMISPRFDVDGKMLLDSGGGGVLRLDSGSAVISAERRQVKSGAISEVVIRERATGRQTTVRSDEMTARGVVGRAAIAAARGTLEARVADAKWLLEQSRRAYDRFSVTVAGGFICQPGDRLSAAYDGLPASGVVTSVRTKYDSHGLRCTAEGYAQATR